MHSLAFSLRDITINVLVTCCQILGMCNLAFSLPDVKINASSCIFPIHFTLHILLFIRDFEQLKGEGFFLILIASMFLYSRQDQYEPITAFPLPVLTFTLNFLVTTFFLSIPHL